MKSKTLTLILIALLFLCFTTLSNSQQKQFSLTKDLLLVNFDCKTDVDDLQTIAAFATVLSDSNFSKMKYHAVAGTYGIQEGLYVPANSLFKLAFKNNWTDAHQDLLLAVEKIKKIVISTLNNEGDIWIAEAGQSDFTAKVIKSIHKDLPKLNISKRIHLIQHSKWNEESTSPESLQFVKENIDYIKIPDGNIVGNGTPGFQDSEFKYSDNKMSNTELNKIWKLAIKLSNTYNGKDERYNNKAISDGGLDFSDLSEVCWILGINDIKDTEHFFYLYAN